jgi:hypothetical protein
MKEMGQDCLEPLERKPQNDNPQTGLEKKRKEKEIY